MTHNCPICDVALEPMPRYPRYVCENCAARATTSNGRPLGFGNADMSGGFIAQYADTGESYDSLACWINGIPCHAEEARFGGIVIQSYASPTAGVGTVDHDFGENAE